MLDFDNSRLVIAQMKVFQLKLEIENVFHYIIVGALAFLISLGASCCFLGNATKK